MMNTTKLSVQECHLLYPLFLENADSHMRAALTVAKVKEYGIANAHLTLAAQDYIKTLNIYLQGWGLPTTQIRTLFNYFSEQEKGYLVSPGVIVLGLFAKSLYRVFETLNKGLSKFDLNSIQQAFEKGLRPIELLRLSARYSKWWSNAKLMQEKGFHVQYNVEVHTPKNISKQDYLQSLDILMDLRENCVGVIDFAKNIPAPQRQAFLNWIKNSFEPFMQKLSRFPFNWKF